MYKGSAHGQDIVQRVPGLKFLGIRQGEMSYALFHQGHCLLLIHPICPEGIINNSSTLHKVTTLRYFPMN